jgi:hypothetical protein
VQRWHIVKERFQAKSPDCGKENPFEPPVANFSRHVATCPCTKEHRGGQKTTEPVVYEMLPHEHERRDARGKNID